jgi:hypothetical protein
LNIEAFLLNIAILSIHVQIFSQPKWEIRQLQFKSGPSRSPRIVTSRAICRKGSSHTQCYKPNPAQLLFCLICIIHPAFKSPENVDLRCARFTYILVLLREITPCSISTAKIFCGNSPRASPIWKPNCGDCKTLIVRRSAALIVCSQPES